MEVNIPRLRQRLQEAEMTEEEATRVAEKTALIVREARAAGADIAGVFAAVEERIPELVQAYRGEDTESQSGKG